MTAPTDAARHVSPARLVHRYYLAMSVPFLIDVVSVFVYAALNGAPQVVLPSLVVTTLFLAGGVGLGAWLLLRPIRHFIEGRVPFGDIERSLARLPRRSATVVGVMYAPMVGLRLLSHRLDITFGATLQQVGWPDVFANLTVGTGFNVVLTFFVVAAFLDRLCEELFRTRGVNIGTFDGRFRRKVALALLFVSFATMVLIVADMLSYSGDRLVREASSDITTSAIGTAFMYYWISSALTRPITRLDGGLRRVADDDYTVRLPVTSNDELGHAASRFNQMVEGLAEKANKTAAELRAALTEVLVQEGVPWGIYGQSSTFLIYPNPFGDPIDPATFDPLKVPIEKLKGARGAGPLTGKIRMGLMTHGVDVMGAPGGFVSATHGGAEIEKTVHALRQTVRALKAEREVKAA